MANVLFGKRTLRGQRRKDENRIRIARCSDAGLGRAISRPASAARVPHSASNSDDAPETPTPPIAVPPRTKSGTPPSMVAIIGAAGEFHVAMSRVELW